MNTHDKYELPPLPTIDVMGKTTPQIWFTAAEVDVLRRAAIEADRELHDRMLAHEWIRPVLGLSEDAPYRFDFYAQEIEKLKAELKKSERNGSDKGNENDHHKRRDEPVGIVKRPSESHYPGVQWIGDVGDGEYLYTSPQPSSESDIPAPSRKERLMSDPKKAEALKRAKKLIEEHPVVKQYRVDAEHQNNE